MLALQVTSTLGLVSTEMAALICNAELRGDSDE